MGSFEVSLVVKRKLFHRGLRAAKEHHIVADATSARKIVRIGFKVVVIFIAP